MSGIPVILSLLLLAGLASPIAAAGSICGMPLTDQFIQDIPEDLPVGTVLRHLNIDGDDTEIEVYETASDPHVAFDPVSRNLTLIQALDAEDPSMSNLQLTLQLTCRILATTQTVALDIVILLLDVNDNAPVFLQDEYTASISELTPVGTTILSGISATDQDMYNIYIYYVIEEGPYSSYFDIPIPAQGVITLEQSLDFEENHDITITVVAKDYHDTVLDQPQPSLNSTATVVITIFDGDDQNPVFVGAPYTARMEENFPVNSLVEVLPPIFAEDGDYGINTSVMYSIVLDTTTDESTYFSIGSTTGLVSLVRTGLHRNTVMTLQIKATQTDNPDRFNTALLRVYVVASNSNPPYFSSPLYTASLVENVPIGSPVLTVAADDNDEGSILSYRFQTNQLVTAFSIDSYSGAVTTVEMLDFEHLSHYNITLEVTDGTYTSSAALSISVIDINDNPPLFDQTSYQFSANRQNGYIIGQVVASDADSNSILAYSLLEDTSLFSVSNTGELIITGAEEDLPLAEYKLVVVAMDSVVPYLQTSAVVNVIFDDVGPIAGGSTQGDDEVDVVLLIILGVICGILLVVIVILLVYIYRKATGAKVAPHKSDINGELSSTLLTDKEHRMRAQTFEQRRFSMQQQNKESQQRSYIDDPKMTQYKQNAAHHLALYNNISSDSTQPQQNPFVPDDSFDYTNEGLDYNRNRPRSQDTGSLAPTIQHQDTIRRHMPYVHEIEYDSAVAPMEQITDDSSSDSMQSSVRSVAESAHTFRAGGSTQNLVTPKGTIKSRKSNVSFIDSANGDLVGSQSVNRDPRMSVVPPEDKPGITVYY